MVRLQHHLLYIISNPISPLFQSAAKLVFHHFKYTFQRFRIYSPFQLQITAPVRERPLHSGRKPLRGVEKSLKAPFLTDLAQIFTSFLTFDTDHKTVFKIGNFVSVSCLRLTSITQK